jgi:folate-binding protein YgfZ
VVSVTSTPAVAARPRAFVGVHGPDAESLLQRLLSNDVAALAVGAACEALLLTPKARVIAPLVVLRRAGDDYLLVTEPELGERLAHELGRARLAAKAEIEPEEHVAHLVLGRAEGGVPVADYGVPAVLVLDGDPAGEAIDDERLEALRILAGTPSWGREVDDRVLPAEAGLVERAVSLTKGCYPGQEPVARLHHRGHANRSLRRLELDGDEPPPYDAEIRHGDRVVGRLTSSARHEGRIVGLGYVRVEVPADAPLAVGDREARQLD